MKQKFLTINFKTLEISRSRLITGIIIGLLSSSVFYSFLYVMREMLRILSDSYNYDLWVLSKAEVSFYNLFIAYVSVIFGQSLCFNYWIDRPKRIYKHKRFRKVSIVNDQRVLMWYFISWFSKLGVAFAIIFTIGLYGGFRLFSFYPEYNYLFILIIIVLFLHVWISIRVSFKRESLKWMLISAIIVSGLSFAYSKVDIIDYKSFNNTILQNKIPHKYNLTLAESNTYQRPERLSLIENIYLVRPRDQSNSNTSIIIIDNKEIPLDSVYSKLQKLKMKRDYGDRCLMIYQLYIDREIKTEVINDLKFEISKLGVAKIAYAVAPCNTEFDQQFYRNYSIMTKQAGIDSTRFNIYEIISYYGQFNKELEIVQLDNGDCIVNNSIVKLDSLCSVFKHIMINNNNFYFKFYPNENVEFSKYISVISQSQEAVNELRNYYSLKLYSKKFDEIHSTQMDEVYEKYPLHFLEFSDDLIRFLEK